KQFLRAPLEVCDERTHVALEGLLSFALAVLRLGVKRRIFFGDGGAFLFERAALCLGLFGFALDAPQVFGGHMCRLIDARSSGVNDLLRETKTARDLKPGGRTGETDEQAIGR